MEKRGYIDPKWTKDVDRKLEKTERDKLKTIDKLSIDFIKEAVDKVKDKLSNG